MELPSYIKNSSQETYNQQLSQILISGLSNRGWTVPNLSTVNIELIGPSMPLGTIWYDTTINKLVVKTADGYEAVTSVLI